MNTLTKNLSLLLLLLSCAFIFPACGSKEVKSEKNSTTALKSGTPVAPPMVVMTATATIVATPTIAINASLINSYTQKTVAKHHASRHAVKQPMMAAITPLVSPVPTLATTAVTFANVAEPAPKKSGTHWPLILAGIALVAALGFYFWTKKAPEHNDFPLPPLGGLSPVGGFTAMRNKVKKETKKQSFWSKKLF